MPILYSEDLEAINESAITVLFGNVKNVDTPCKMDHVQARYPIDCYDVARFLATLIKQRLKVIIICIHYNVILLLHNSPLLK